MSTVDTLVATPDPDDERPVGRESTTVTWTASSSTTWGRIDWSSATTVTTEQEWP